jgi:hypothetical protein
VETRGKFEKGMLGSITLALICLKKSKIKNNINFVFVTKNKVSKNNKSKLEEIINLYRDKLNIYCHSKNKIDKILKLF